MIFEYEEMEITLNANEIIRNNLNYYVDLEFFSN